MFACIVEFVAGVVIYILFFIHLGIGVLGENLVVNVWVLWFICIEIGYY